MELSDQLKQILIKINFKNRYSKLCDVYNNFDNRARNFELDKVEEIIKNNNYSFKFNSKESFFKVNEKIQPYNFTFNIIIKDGIVQFVWDIKKNDIRIHLGWGMWESIIEFMANEEFTRKPIFTNYNDLNVILSEGFKIYEDFKNELYQSSSI